ncbi:TIGR02099 family protein [Pseudoalteromonas luteoviolacea]|uniref:YhdP family protein n=1 Tax=Pseudoalteromonas luteoviolacea TaxID=43657 RepID=UPI001B38A9BF|nr:YhdP family protein [Pseudoalteromonas luteoviolacea]MBQ4812135.1 TIGR02099 family protein [Pseudoalteromonas luteoviolacea]
MRKVWQVFAVTLVTLAVLVSLLKLTLPYANDYKSSIESLIYEQLNVELSIGSISASWQGTGPALLLKNVSFEDNQASPISVQIESTNLQVNVVESIRQWQLISNYFVLDGFKANIYLDKLDLGNSSGEFEQQALIEGLFLGDTGHFSVQNSEIHLFAKTQKRHSVLIQDMVWQNSELAHHGEGRLVLPNLSQGSLDTLVRLEGKTLNDIGGEIFLQARELNVLELIDEHLDETRDALSASINGQLWARLNQGKIDDIQLQFEPSYLKWQSEDKNNQLGLDSGQLQLLKHADGWRINSSELYFSHGERVFEPVLLQGEWQNETSQLWLKQFNLELLVDALSLTHYDWANQLVKSDVVGQLTQAKVSWHQQQGLNVWGILSSVGWQESHLAPGFSGLGLEFHWLDNRAVVSLNAHQQQLVTGPRFIEPIAIEELNGDIHFWTDENNYWHAQSSNLWLSNSDLSVALEFHTRLFDEPELDLYAEAYGGDARIAGRYFPLELMHSNLVEYLNKGILAGQNKGTQVLVSGPLKDFPYRGTHGQFEVLADIQDAEFLFAPDWPSIHDADVSLHFINQRMDITTRSGQLANQQIQGDVAVRLADLEQADILTVDINQTTEAASLMPFFAATPIADPLVDVLDVVRGQGSVSGVVGLEIDLENLDVLARGRVQFADNTIHLSQPGMTLKGVFGELKFKDDDIAFEGGQATWLDMPLSFSVKGGGDKQGYLVNIDTAMQISSDKLLPYGHGIMDGFIEGHTQLDTDITLNFEDAGFNYLASFRTDLNGVEVNLPPPYQKAHAIPRILSGEVRGDDISNLITANYDNNLYFNGILNNQNGLLDKAHLVVSQQNRGLDKSGFVVTIEHSELALEPWFEFIDRIIDISAKPSSGEAQLLPKLNEIRANLGQLNIGGLLFNDFEMRMTPQQQALKMRLTGKELRAQVLIPTEGRSDPIQVQADYLRLNSQKEDETEAEDVSLPLAEQQWLANIPAIEFGCDDCRLNQYQLDRVNLSMFGDGQRLNITALNIDKGTHTLSAKGSWQNGISQVMGNLSSADFGDLMEEFDITSTVKDSQANIDFDIQWQSAPYDFQWASLGGEIQWRLGEGHLTDISDQGARVFSLLSLDSLVRKLKLDFRDVFAKGFFYNQMEGSLQLESGIAYTRDTKMDGVPADLSISGYANLKTQEINYDLAIAPQVTSSLPVIVGWMVNPVTGLAALAIDKVIHSARVISEINFKVTGTMKEPIVTEVDRKSREVTIPGVSKPPAAAQPEPQGTEKQNDAGTPPIQIDVEAQPEPQSTEKQNDAGTPPLQVDAEAQPEPRSIEKQNDAGTPPLQVDAEALPEAGRENTQPASIESEGSSKKKDLGGADNTEGQPLQ